MHSHTDYLSRSGNSSLLAMHMRIYHGDNNSNPEVPCTPHCHWVTSGSDFDKTVPVKFTEGTTVAVTDLADLPGDHLAADYWGAGLLPLTETVLPAYISTQDQAALTPPDLELHQLFCTWTC
ncbi:hypothetical protein [Gimesia panareensis]|uniref:hypothetical protein n=1 Tax=Gimesia panareensis TaxID=2527978 RepID=UPI0011A4744A|nr:hypothetical protein [Gimesia panareensis]